MFPPGRYDRVKHCTNFATWIEDVGMSTKEQSISLGHSSRPDARTTLAESVAL